MDTKDLSGWWLTNTITTRSPPTLISAGKEREEEGKKIYCYYYFSLLWLYILIFFWLVVIKRRMHLYVWLSWIEHAEQIIWTALKVVVFVWKVRVGVGRGSQRDTKWHEWQVVSFIFLKLTLHSYLTVWCSNCCFSV